MLTSPFLIPGLLLVGALLTYIVTVLQPRYANYVPTTASGLSMIVWVISGQQLRDTSSYGNQLQSTGIAAWQWAFDDTIWPLIGVLLLFIFAIFLFRLGFVASPAPFDGQSLRPNDAQWQPVFLLCLSAMGFLVMGAASTHTFMMTWTLLGILWAIFLFSVVEERANLIKIMPRFFWILAPLFFAGLVAASQPIGANLLDFGNWSVFAIVATLLAIMAQMGILPFIGWRPRSEAMPVDAGAVLHLMPALVGASLFIRLLNSGRMPSTIALLLTLMALLSIMQGLRRIWMYGQTSASLPADLALVLTSLAFLAGIWVGTTVVVAAVRLFVFTSTIFFFLERLPPSRDRWWRTIPLLLALIAVLGFPLTSGFVTLTSVYDSWFFSNRYVFILALAALWLPLLTALFVKSRRSIVLPPPPKEKPIDSMLMEGGQLLMALGLVMVLGRALREIHFLTWLILLLVGVGAYFLSRYMGEAQSFVTTVNTAFKPGQNQLSSAWHLAGRFGRQVVSILSESAYILEGEQGLVWLTAFLAVLMIALVL